MKYSHTLSCGSFDSGSVALLGHVCIKNMLPRRSSPDLKNCSQPNLRQYFNSLLAEITGFMGQDNDGVCGWTRRIGRKGRMGPMGRWEEEKG
jgi:hypothetical protein